MHLTKLWIPSIFSGGYLGVWFNGQKGHFVFSFFFTKGTRLGNRRVPLERLVPLSFHSGSTHVRVHATKRYHLSRVHRRIMAGFPPKATRATCTYTRKNIHSAAFVRGRRQKEREKKKKKKKGTDDRGWLKWINDRRTREKYAVETEGLDIVTSAFPR